MDWAYANQGLMRPPSSMESHPKPATKPVPKPQPAVASNQCEDTNKNPPCFPAGTPLRVPGGWRSIEDIQAGDLVLSRDEFDHAGNVIPKTVEEVFVSEGLIWSLHVGGQVIQTTAEHPFFVQYRGWVPCHELKIGDRLATEDGQWVPVEDLLDTGEWVTLYNFRVADFHTYFVGKEDWGFCVWSHNTCYYHGTSAAGALSILATGVDTSFTTHVQDFGRGFYTTISLPQARKWANKIGKGTGVVLAFDIPDNEIRSLSTFMFPAVGGVDWQTTVWRGWRGLLMNEPLRYDLVIGPYVLNPGALTADPSSKLLALPEGDQRVWISPAAVAVLNRHKPVPVPVP